MSIPTPLAYWKFDESSGDAVDQIAAANLTNNNTVAYASGLINNGADFGSTNSTKTFTNANQYGLTVNADRSFAGWIKPTGSLSGAVWDIMGMGYNANSVFYAFEYIDFGAGVLRFRVGRARSGVDDPNILYTTTLTLNTWYHIAYTFNGATLAQELFINGVSVATSTAVSSGNGSGGVLDGTAFSRALWGASRFYQGMVDEWGIWGSILSSGDISSLYNGGTGQSYPFTGAAINSGFFRVM